MARRRRSEIVLVWSGPSWRMLGICSRNNALASAYCLDFPSALTRFWTTSIVKVSEPLLFQHVGTYSVILHHEKNPANVVSAGFSVE